MNDRQELAHVPVTIQETEILTGAAKVLSHIRPKWQQDNIKYKMFTDGITNKLVACSLGAISSEEDVVLVRVYGEKTDLLIDRKAETRNLMVMHKAGYAPRLYATFNNGLAYEFVPGDTLTTVNCRDPSVFPLVAVMMARMHRLDCGQASREPIVWSKSRQFIRLAPDTFSDPEKQKRFNELKLPGKSQLETEMVALESHLRKLESPIVFCHNDLLLGNVVHDASKSAVTFIDYEYAGYNHQAFDIGNHFNEFAGVSTVDYTLYPDLEFQKSWLKVYLREFKSLGKIGLSNGQAIKDNEPSNEEVGKLLVVVNKFALASHFLWATWALVQAEHSTIDFDYLGYASTRLQEYFTRKEEFLSMSYPV